MSPQQCRKLHTSREFVEYNVLALEEVNGFHREDFFWAMIAFKVAQSNSEHPERIKFESFLLKFHESEEVTEKPKLKQESIERLDIEYVEEGPETKELSEEERQTLLKKNTFRIEASKQAWGALVGLAIMGDTATKIENMR